MENEKLKFQTKLSDSIINLNNNKENLISFIYSENKNDPPNNTSINELLTENKALSEKFHEVFKIKNNKEKNFNKVLLNLESKINSEREKVSNSNNEIYYMNTKLKEKDQNIENLKCEIDRYITLDLEFAKEIYLTDPKKNNIDIINEINFTKDIMNKFSKMFNYEKNNKDKVDNEINVCFFFYIQILFEFSQNYLKIFR